MISAGWNVEEECRKLRFYHFEDLDYVDQKACPLLVAFLEHAMAILEPVFEVRRLDCLKEIIVQYHGFADQARQLYDC